MSVRLGRLITVQRVPLTIRTGPESEAVGWWLESAGEDGGKLVVVDRCVADARIEGCDRFDVPEIVRGLGHSLRLRVGSFPAEATPGRRIRGALVRRKGRPGRPFTDDGRRVVGTEAGSLPSAAACTTAASSSSSASSASRTSTTTDAGEGSTARTGLTGAPTTAPTLGRLVPRSIPNSSVEPVKPGPIPGSGGVGCFVPGVERTRHGQRMEESSGT